MITFRIRRRYAKFGWAAKIAILFKTTSTDQKRKDFVIKFLPGFAFFFMPIIHKMGVKNPTQYNGDKNVDTCFIAQNWSTENARQAYGWDDP